MSRETSQNADLDFEQMMGELAAMKSDLANRQANRVGSRPTTPRVAGADGEPRRTRLRRAATEPRPELSLASDEDVHNLSVANVPAVPSPSSPVLKRSVTTAAGQRDLVHEKDQAQTHGQDQDQSEPLIQEQNQQTEQADRNSQEPHPVANPPVDNSQLHSNGPNPHTHTSLDSAALGDTSTNLVRSESRRSITPAVPLPPKSAQRSRSISHNSSRLSQISGESNAQDGLNSPSQEASAPLSPLAAPRNFLRPYPSSPSLSTANGQLAPASPRIPARSNSRSVRSTAAAGSQSTPIDSAPPSPLFGGGAPPVIPSRARSASRSLSRSNTLNRPETVAEHAHTHATPAISEGYEGQSPIQEQHPRSSVPEEPRESNAAEAPPASPGHIRKKSSSNVLQPMDEMNESVGHTLAPSLLPAEPIPSSSERRPQRSPTSDDVEFGARPVLRKQKSVDPAAMYRQQSQDHMARDLPSISRHASERRPNRERQQSNAGQGGRSREPTHEIVGAQERGRSQTSDENSSKGGFFSWARSRSKSRDAPSTRPTYDTSHPVPEQPTYSEYNPALIPSRSTSSARDKSLPRKPSNPNFQANGFQEGMLHQRSKSFKLGVTGSNGVGDHPVPFGSSLKVSKSTIHHENMVRGMGMGSTPISPAVLLTPQPSVPLSSPGASPFTSPSSGPSRGIALAMMKDDGALSSSDLQMQQRHQQLQQAQMQHLQQQQQILAAAVSSTSPPATPGSSHNQFNGSQGPLSPTAGAAAPPTQRLVATRIYIQTETDFRSLNLASDTTALDALQMLQQRGCFGEPGDGRYHDRWTIFEYSKEFLIERPLRDFEVILDVIKTWEADKDNKMICKSFPARDELSAKEVARLVGPAGQASFVRPQGMVYLETKKSKWEKRYLHATDTAVYHAKDSKGSGERMLCLLKNFDVYAVQVPRKKAPTKFGFALKSSDKIHLFETPEDDYIHYVCLESGESLREWLAGLRAAKGMFMYHANPEMIREGQKHAAELLTSTTRGNLTEEQVSMAEAKLAGWGALNSNRPR
ncbi:hypothetical protein EMPS_10246 [Entomortierella parvispora]|uniref:PH domain-containing protein n=1 Tax=Entomortierella parvispora TaxID=205924 RepID=A0A9P3M150_9FUNG|nr:hypothetical protein EMPS_10246 [Entomortierella parvispora]